MGRFFTFLIGFATSMFIITCTDFKTWDACDFVPYIGPSLLGALIYLRLYIADDKIEKLENRIKELEKKI